ncbi:MAG: PH domain-containing protein [bacterium]|nr:PH domain-containing protein [bacterium]
MKQLHPKARTLLFLTYIVRAFPFLLVLTIIGLVTLFGIRADAEISSGVTFMKWLWLPADILAVLATWYWAKWVYDNYRYEITPDGFKSEYGVIRKKYISIPYERIQNVDIHRGIIYRIMGLSDLQIQTASNSFVHTGGRHGRIKSLPEGRLPGIDKDEAKQLQEELSKKARGNKG